MRNMLTGPVSIAAHCHRIHDAIAVRQCLYHDWSHGIQRRLVIQVGHYCLQLPCAAIRYLADGGIESSPTHDDTEIRRLTLSMAKIHRDSDRDPALPFE